MLNGNGTVNAYNGAPFFGSPPAGDSDIYRDIAVMPDGQGYVALTGAGLVYKFGSAADPANLGNVSMPYYPGQDIARSITITPDGKGYLVLNGDGTITKWGSATTGAIAALGSPSWPNNDLGRSLAIMPDGAGYLVLDAYGGVNKYGSATQGAVGSGTTTYWGTDLGRDIFVVSAFGAAFGYYVLDAWGGVLNTAGLPAGTNPSATLFRDRWRGLTIYGGKPLLLRNDGTTVLTN